ncbi:tripartite tricarboxylate transporter substrate-binding protein [Hydrogenophaga sp. 2FB]|uniref:tripartite tricarboxylate transporter substrate-binding protein n=1 Tax=Hydrogenophaga sp. 2FB TaxID=2502187 RepID=UPI0010F55480|nr:tripartite tricarboxylate transporter substrate-binding protein [Hydrogenophaga sp. 2FB]
MNTLSRRHFGAGGLATLAAAAWPMATWAQASGSPRRLIVGYPAGGTLDQTARRVAEAWRKAGTTFIVDNRSGAAGRLANSQLKRERGDGNTLLCTHTSALSIYPHVYTKLMYDAVADFVPITPVVSATCALAISNAVPPSVKTLADYAKWVQQSPDRAMYASPAAGSMAHFLGFQFSEAAHLKLQHVGYRGSAPAMNDMLGGQIPAYMGFVADFLPYMQSGKLRILAVSGEKRSRFMPGVPTFPEQGHGAITGIESYGIFAPPGTPEAMVKTLHDEVLASTRDQTLVAGFEEVGLELFTLTPKAYERYIQTERDKWGPVVRASGFKSEE